MKAQDKSGYIRVREAGSGAGGGAGLWVGTILAAGVLAGCSGSGSEAATPTIELTSTAPTTVATTTTSTTEATTTTIDPNIAEIEAVYVSYHDLALPLGEIFVDPKLADFAGDPLLSRFWANSYAWIADGLSVGVSAYEVHILEILVSGERATVRSCDLDAVSLLDPSGSVRTPADTERYYRVADFELADGVWKMVERQLEGGTGTVCAPA